MIPLKTVSIMKTPIPILLYHSISETASPAFQRWIVTPEQFEAQLTYLWRQAYTPLTVTDFVKRCMFGHLQLPRNPILITFDDGFADFLQTAVPIMSKFEFSSTLYITTGYVNNTSQWLADQGEGDRLMLTWDEVRQLPHHRVEVGAHTHTHPQLDLLTRHQARKEIVWSKHLLEQELGRSVDSFAYPHGYFDSRIHDIVQQAGFTSACAVKHALSARDDDRFALSRIIISHNTTLPEFAHLVQGNQLRVAPTRERWRTKAWRWKRRFDYAGTGA